MKYLFASDLARALEVPEDKIFELARQCHLPFAITSASPRQLFIESRDLAQWQAAAAGYCERN
jgi:hypothetical protein